jgi:ribonuclease VapC
VTIFADASALIAIIAGESEADGLADRLDADPARLCSAVSAWETVAGLRRSYNFSLPSARRLVERYLDAGAFQFVAIGPREFGIATDAYAEYGKGRHPAALNMGDCFAYACTKSNRAKLLFKGTDFSRTDIDAA